MDTQEKYDIFISYRKDDTREKVELLSTKLKTFYSKNKYPKMLKIFYDQDALSQRWSEMILDYIDSDTCDKFIIVIGDNTFNFTDEDRSSKVVDFYEDLARLPKIDTLRKIKKYKRENPNKRIDYMRLEIARALQKPNVNIVPLCLYREVPFEIEDLNLPADIRDLENYQGVTYLNHKSNTSPIETTFPNIDRHLFAGKFKPYNNWFQYIMSVLRTKWHWATMILAMLCVCVMWVQKYSGSKPNFMMSKAPQAIATTINNSAENEYVDLGLSVKWATCNVGASSPIEKGSTFAWGEVLEEKYHNWEFYKYSRGNTSYITKYCDNETLGVVDRKTKLELTDDAAYVNWGTNWRIPTKKEFEELQNKCSWKLLDTINNVKGYLVIGKNGKSIFLPFNGYVTHTVRTVENTKSYIGHLNVANNGSGYYWTSSLDINKPTMAWGFLIDSNRQGMTTFDRYCGLNIRPVYCGK